MMSLALKFPLASERRGEGDFSFLPHGLHPDHLMRLAGDSEPANDAASDAPIGKRGARR